MYQPQTPDTGKRRLYVRQNCTKQRRPYFFLNLIKPFSLAVVGAKSDFEGAVDMGLIFNLCFCEATRVGWKQRTWTKTRNQNAAVQNNVD